MKIIVAFIFLLVVTTKGYSDECAELGGSVDGVPAEFHQLKCKALVAFAKSDYLAANKYYKNALKLKFFEAPNYSLYLNLGRSQCLAGESDVGLESIKKFILMANADLGNISCPIEEEDDYEEVIQSSEHMQLACEGYGSTLSEWARVELETLLILAAAYIENCENA